MAYETEKNRLSQLITNTVGIDRIRDSYLEREATERALEARQQTGLNVGDADGYDLIRHPTADQRAARLGVPTTVYTAELATWNYLHTDPVLAAANGLLNSTPHRNILDSTLYKYWGIGIYTEMPPGETNELLRRWYFILWFSNKAIGEAAMTTPTEAVNKPVQFGNGRHYAYRFTYDGKIASTKTTWINGTSRATAKGRGKIPNRPGVWLLMKDGAFADYWVEETAFRTDAKPKLTA